MRVSDVEREHVGQLLQRAVGQGRLTIGEFAVRMDTAMAARTRGELHAVLLDLPVDPAHVAPAEVLELSHHLTHCDRVATLAPELRHSTISAPQRASGGDGMFALVVRFYLRDQDAANGFDELVAKTVAKIRDHEPDTITYAVHKVKDAPLSRIFYELYSSREAFDAHEQQEHTRRFLDERGQYLTGTRVEFLESPLGKGTANAAQ